MKSGSWAALGAGPCRALAAGAAARAAGAAAADALLAVACAAAAHAPPAAVGMHGARRSIENGGLSV